MSRFWSVLRTGLRAVGAPARWVLISLIKLYRSTLIGVLGGQCRFHPSCSAYAEQAVREHGAVRGVLLATWRVLRCTPFSRGGLDPVPASSRSTRAYDSVIPGVEERRTA